MNVSYIVFPEKEKAEFVTKPFTEKCNEKQVLVKTEFSAVSAGTELANYHALPNTAPTHYSLNMENLSYPFYPGYSLSGTVTDIGAGVQKVKPGDRVILSWCGHRSLHMQTEDKVIKIPDGVSLEEAAFTHISSFPFLGVRKLNIQLGEGVMIAGLGVLGLFALQIAKLSGACPVAACDFSPERRAMALALGADQVFDPGEPDFIPHVKEYFDGTGPAAVVEVTGHADALQQALEYIGWMGRITLLGCTRIPENPTDFYTYVHKRGISLIGCHTFTRPAAESRPGMWTEQDDYRTFLRLVAAGRMKVKPMIQKIADAADAEKVYHEIGFSKNPVFGVLFDWRNIG